MGAVERMKELKLKLDESKKEFGTSKQKDKKAPQIWLTLEKWKQTAKEIVPRVQEARKFAQIYEEQSQREGFEGNKSAFVGRRSTLFNSTREQLHSVQPKNYFTSLEIDYESEQKELREESPHNVDAAVVAEIHSSQEQTAQNTDR